MRIDGKLETYELLGIDKEIFKEISDKPVKPIDWFRYLKGVLDRLIADELVTKSYSELLEDSISYNLYMARKKTSDFYQRRIEELQ